MRKLVVALSCVLSTLAAPALAAKPLPIKEFKLDNGLKVLLLENRKAPVVTFQVWYHTGSRNEPIGQSGISHFLEHVMFLGTQKYPGNTYDRLTESNGGSNNAFTSKDYTCFYVDFGSEQLDLAARLEADRMQNLLVNPEKFPSELNVVKEERRWRTDNSPTGAMMEELYALAFKNHPYRWPVIGWMDDLDHMSREKMLAYYKTFYAPNNATIVIVGDFKTPEALGIVKKHFGAIPPAKRVPKLMIKEAPQTSERRSTLVREVSTPNVLMGYHAPAIGTPDHFVLSIIDSILNGGESSRMHQDLVEKRKLAQEISTDVDAYKDPGLFSCFAVPMPGRTLPELETAIEEHLERLKQEPVSDHELEKAINNAEAGFILGQQKNHSLGVTIGHFDVQADYRLVNRYVDELRKVNKEDIQRVAKQVFVKNNRTVVTLLPREEKK